MNGAFAQFHVAVRTLRRLERHIDEFVDLLWARPRATLAVLLPRLAAWLLRVLLGIALGERSGLTLASALRFIEELAQLLVLAFEPFDAFRELRAARAVVVARALRRHSSLLRSPGGPTHLGPYNISRATDARTMTLEPFETTQPSSPSSVAHRDRPCAPGFAHEGRPVIAAAWSAKTRQNGSPRSTDTVILDRALTAR